MFLTGCDLKIQTLILNQIIGNSSFQIDSVLKYIRNSTMLTSILLLITLMKLINYSN